MFSEGGPPRLACIRMYIISHPYFPLLIIFLDPFCCGRHTLLIDSNLRALHAIMETTQGKQDAIHESEEKSTSKEGMTTIGPKDVILGRSERALANAGNKYFNQLLKENADFWKSDKSGAINAIIESLNPGRFLKIMEDGSFKTIKEERRKTKIQHAMERHAVQNAMEPYKKATANLVQENVRSTNKHTKATAKATANIVHKKAKPQPKQTIKATRPTPPPVPARPNKDTISPPSPKIRTEEMVDLSTKREIIYKKLEEDNTFREGEGTVSTTTERVVGQIMRLEDVPKALLESSHVFVTTL